MLHVEGVLGLVTCGIGIGKTALFLGFGARVHREFMVVRNPWDEMRWDRNGGILWFLYRGSFGSHCYVRTKPFGVPVSLDRTPSFVARYNGALLSPLLTDSMEFCLQVCHLA
jgi:hypothetical protein